MEKYTNNAQTTLNGAINNSVTSLVVTSAATFPTAANFRLRIEDEIMLVTAVSGTTFTVTRGIEGTTAASHPDQAPVRHILTAGALAGQGGWTEVIKSADQDVSSNTVVAADSELSFTAVSGQLYEIEAAIIYSSPVGGGTPDIKYCFGEDTTVRGMLLISSLSTTDAAQSVSQTAVSNGANTAGTATAKRLLFGRGMAIGNGGTFAFRWAQNTSGSNATRVHAGSVLRYRPVP